MPSWKSSSRNCRLCRQCKLGSDARGTAGSAAEATRGLPARLNRQAQDTLRISSSIAFTVRSRRSVSCWAVPRPSRRGMRSCTSYTSFAIVGIRSTTIVSPSIVMLTCSASTALDLEVVLIAVTISTELTPPEGHSAAKLGIASATVRTVTPGPHERRSSVKSRSSEPRPRRRSRTNPPEE
eukprot:1794985-Prymnesium_polylepis.1